MYSKFDHKVGASLVELIMAMTVFSMVVFTLVTSIIYGLESVSLAGDRVRAVLLAEEGLEAARNIKDEDFANLSAGTFGVSQSGGVWTLSGTSDTTDDFIREVDLVALDANTYEVTSRVAWTQSVLRSGEIELVSRLTNWFVESLIGNWSTPILDSELNLSGSGNGWKIQVDGNYAHIVRSSGSPDYVIVDVSNPALPLVVGNAVVPGGLRDIRISGNYAFITSTDNSREILVYDISIPALPVQVDTLNLSGSTNGYALDLVGDVLHVVRQGSSVQYLTIDISDPTNISVLDSVNASGSSRDIEIAGDYAFVGSNSNPVEIEIFDISNPSNIQYETGYNLSGNADADTLEVIDDVLVVGRSNGDVYIMDVSDIYAASLYSVFDAEDDVNDMDVGNDGNYLFIGTDENPAEMQIIDITDRSAPFLVGTFDADGDINGVYYDSSTDRFYGVGEDNSQELVILEPS
jgi:Tfp pilus assembly protein PilV